ncbi:MAG: hypothetical protein AB1390_10745 [Nitrospirota bacterium]
MTKERYQFDNFYNNMYLPFITRVHGNRAIIMSYEEMEKKSQTCELLLVKKEKKYVAGLLINYESINVPHLWHVGIKNGNADSLKIGPRSAVDYFAANYLEQKGYKKINYGVVRGFLKDGVLRYKKQRGFRITDSTENGFLIRPLLSSNGTREFFLNNPFICVNRGSLVGAIFVESDQLCTDKDLKKLYKNYHIKGLSNLNIYLFGDDKRNICESIPDDLSEKISIFDAASIF